MIRKRLPMNMEAANPQNTSGLVSNNRGPGLMPKLINPPSITAVVSLPGTPRISRGINEPTEAELLADSGAATPRISPLPNWFGRRIFFSVA